MKKFSRQLKKLSRQLKKHYRTLTNPKKSKRKQKQSKQKTLIMLFGGFLLLLIGVGVSVYLLKKDNQPPTPETTTIIIEDVKDPVTPDYTVLPDQAAIIPKTLDTVHGHNNQHELTEVPSQYTTKNEQVHQNVISPLLSLIDSAHQDGITITVVSGYRSYERQKSIWENKWGQHADDDLNKARDILRYSSFPGTSRHHWGTDIDFNSVSPAYWQSPEGMRVFDWLTQNAPRFGFCQTYGKGRSHGYEEEPWHWSHIPTASRYYAQISEPAVLEIALAQEVKGAQAVRTLAPEMMNYITGINACPAPQTAHTSPQSTRTYSTPSKPHPTSIRPSAQPTPTLQQPSASTTIETHPPAPSYHTNTHTQNRSENSLTITNEQGQAIMQISKVVNPTPPDDSTQ